MNKPIVKINIFPDQLKSSLIRYINQNSNIIGYKQITSKKKLPLLEFKDKTRLWILYQEINTL